MSGGPFRPYYGRSWRPVDTGSLQVTAATGRGLRSIFEPAWVDGPNRQGRTGPGARGSGRTTLTCVPTDPAPVPTVPRPVKIAAAVVALEGLVVAAVGIVEAFTINADRLVMGATTAVFLLLYGGGLLLVGRGLSRVASWSRGPAVFSQLIQLLMGYSFWGGSTTWLSVTLVVVALVVLVALFQRSSTEALADDPTRDRPVL